MVSGFSGGTVGHGGLMCCEGTFLFSDPPKQSQAKSKCTDSVKIYQYHGSNRNRDPKFLANQDIVVTTYQEIMAMS